MLQRLYQCLFALLLSGPAFADSGFYVGGDVGFSWADNPTEIEGFTHQAESDAVNAKIGFRFHNDHYYMRVEGQYDDSLYGLIGIVMGFGYQY